MALYSIRRHINGISINPYEYVLKDNGNVMFFMTEADALEFVKENLGLDITMLESAGIEIHGFHEGHIKGYNSEGIIFDEVIKLLPE
jgi:hypothetical protein